MPWRGKLRPESEPIGTGKEQVEAKWKLGQDRIRPQTGQAGNASDLSMTRTGAGPGPGWAESVHTRVRRGPLLDTRGPGKELIGIGKEHVQAKWGPRQDQPWTQTGQTSNAYD